MSACTTNKTDYWLALGLANPSGCFSIWPLGPGLFPQLGHPIGALVGGGGEAATKLFIGKEMLEGRTVTWDASYLCN